MTTLTLERASVAPPRAAHEMPRELDLHEIGGVLDGSLRVADVPAISARLAVDVSRERLPHRGEHDEIFGPQHTATSALPDARVWTQRFALALVEALAGRRSPTQLTPHTSTDVLARIQRRHRTTLRRGAAPGPTGVRRVQVCQPCDGVVEAAVVARVNGRATPIALRLNGVDGRWQVTVLELI